MKKLLAILLSVIVTVSTFSALFTLTTSAAAPELITNGNFETGPFDTNMQSPGYNSTFSNWMDWFRITGGNASINNQIITDPDDESNHIGKVMQNILHGVPVEEGKTYTLSFRYRTEFQTTVNIWLDTHIDYTTTNNGTAYNGVSMPMSLLSATRTRNGTTVNTGVATAGTSTNIGKIVLAAETTNYTEWAEYSITFTAGARAFSGQIILQIVANNYNGTNPQSFYLDDVSLVRSAPPSNLFQNSNFETSTGNTTDIAKISADGNGLSGTGSDTATSRIIAKPTTLVEAQLGKWFRADGGSVTTVVDASTTKNAYSAIVEEYGNSTNHIAKVGQTLMQGVRVSPGLRYSISYKIRLKPGLVLPNNSCYDITLRNDAGAAMTTYQFSNAAMSYSYDNGDGTTTTSSDAMSLLNAYTMRLNMKTLENVITNQWVTVNYAFTLTGSVTVEQMVYLNFLATTFNIYVGNPGNYFVYMDDVTLIPDVVTNDLTSLVQSSFETVGTAIRSEGIRPQALRFKTSVNKQALTSNYFLNKYTIVEYGTVAIKTAYLPSGASLEFKDYLQSDGLTVKNALKGIAYSAASGVNIIYSEDATNIQYTAALIGIPKTDLGYNASYSVRAYAVLDDGSGNTVTIYDNDTRNATVFDIAKLAYEATGTAYSDVNGHSWAESYETRQYLYNNILTTSGYSGNAPAAVAE